MFERVSWGVGFTFITGQFVTGGSLSGSFKFFPAPIFFLGANLGFSYRSITFWQGMPWEDSRNSFGGTFTPELGFRLGGRGMAFFSDIGVGIPMHLGSTPLQMASTFEVNIQPSIRLGGAW